MFPLSDLEDIPVKTVLRLVDHLVTCSALNTVTRILIRCLLSGSSQKQTSGRESLRRTREFGDIALRQRFPSHMTTFPTPATVGLGRSTANGTCPIHR
jgi:hypothetical protein